MISLVNYVRSGMIIYIIYIEGGISIGLLNLDKKQEKSNSSMLFSGAVHYFIQNN